MNIFSEVPHPYLGPTAFMPFSVVELIKGDVFGSYQVMADGFYIFERLEHRISLSYSKKTPPMNAVSY